MRAATAKVTSKGQFTLPAEVRAEVGVKVGDTIEFVVHRTGEVFIIPRSRPASSIVGRAAHSARPMTEDEREKAVAGAILERGAPETARRVG